jgi:hypothetical protein
MAVFGQLPQSILDAGIEIKSAGVGSGKARLWWINRDDEEAFIELAKEADLTVGWLRR